jgi:hypothetical protein
LLPLLRQKKIVSITLLKKCMVTVTEDAAHEEAAAAEKAVTGTAATGGAATAAQAM